MRLKSGIAVTTFAVFSGLIAGLVGYAGHVGVRFAPPANRINLTIDVPDISNLEVGSNVLVRGVQVGKVTGIDVSVAAATIHFDIAGQYKVPVDSDVRLENLSALGEGYIEVDPRSSGGPTLRDGQRITPEMLKAKPSISQLGASVVRVLNQLDPQQLSRVVGEADAALPAPGGVLPNLARSSRLLRNTTADFKGQGREVLDNLQVLLKNAGFVGPALAAGMPAIQDTLLQVNNSWDNAWFVGLQIVPGDILMLSALVDRIQKFIDTRGIDLKVLGEATSANVKLIAAAIKNVDSSQILANLLATVPEDGAIDLHVKVP